MMPPPFKRKFVSSSCSANFAGAENSLGKMKYSKTLGIKSPFANYNMSKSVESMLDSAPAIYIMKE